ncbi:helix-turn-helix domain-containing protein [Brevibacillus sp. 179-C9.3 HS]|uniref:helix-turn-helix domain-containing protein n=1 Tax=unclassified Brevibacillus TaxID=2684853 RepID=UPI0039A3D66D
MSAITETHTTIGDLIKKYRGDISLSELSSLSGIERSVIGKIESGDTKRPELKTLAAIFEALNAPREQMIEYYVIVEKRLPVLRELLMEAIQLSSFKLTEKVTVRLLESPQGKSEELVEELYQIALSVEDVGVKLLLLNKLVRYCRMHGIQPFLAKSLFQKYMIEQADITRLEESFKLGEEVLYYTDFLSKEERIDIYYLLSFDAHDMKKYERCIEYGKRGHAEDLTNNETKERIALAICNSYMRLGKFTEMEEHIQMYEKLGYHFIIERAKYLRAVILSKTGNYHEAVPLLRDCLKEATKNNRIHRVNELIEALLSINDVNSVQEIIDTEEENFVFDFNNAYNFSELGRYYKYKGIFLVSRGLFDEGMDAYLQSMIYYGKINDRDSILTCIEEINTHHCNLDKDADLGLLMKLREVYNMVNLGKGKRNNI